MDNERRLTWTLAADCRITRRKYYHCAISPDGAVTLRYKLLGDMIEALEAHEVDTFELVADSCRWRVSIQRIRE